MKSKWSKMFSLLRCLVLGFGIYFLSGVLYGDVKDEYSVLYSGRTSVMVMKGNDIYMSLSVGGWGPKWSWQGWSASVENLDNKFMLNCKTKDFSANILYSQEANSIHADASLTAEKSQEITAIIIGCSFPGVVNDGGTWVAKTDNGTELKGKMPFNRGIFAEDTRVSRIDISDPKGVVTSLVFANPVNLSTDNGELRIHFASKRVEEGMKYRFKFSLELPGEARLYADPRKIPGIEDTAQWYKFEGTGHPKEESILDLSDWSKEPAGAKGRIEMKDDKLIYGGKEIKLWGINVCYADCAPSKELAEKRASLYKRYGINSVRLHKYADGSGWQGILSKDDASVFDSAGLDRMDYFIAKLKEAGIFVKLSPIFYVKPRSANRKDIPYYDEFQINKDIAQTGGGAMYLGTELQDLQIRQMNNLFDHKNPYTGLRYADDPAIAVVEITNEDSILFYNTLNVLQKVPTLRKRAGNAFSAWLKNKYGTKEKLLAAWGKNMLGTFKAEGFPDESWEKDEIYPIGNPWFYSPGQLEGSQKHRKARLLDTIEFLTSIQDEVYKRMAEAMRKAGYEGIMLASNWQAGAGTSHYMNLHSGYLIGIIDRHNYFGGGDKNIVRSSSMLALPGSGILSSGFQQVANRPFMMSEWIHVSPNEWGVEGPAIIGAYGMGLQGWDVSYMFQNRDEGEFMRSIQASQHNVWQITVPQILGSFPVAARMVRRSDVTEAKNIHTLNVHLPSMLKGIWNFRDITRQEYDAKSFETDIVPTEALAVSRIAVKFTDKEEANQAFALDTFKKGNGFISDTGELYWEKGSNPRDGFFTIKTKGTEAITGFAEGKTAAGNFADITVKSRFASIFLTARNQDKTLSDDKQIILSAIARARNFGAIYVKDTIISNFGNDKEGPIVMEPVIAEITLHRKAPATVFILDHDGVNTGQSIPIENGVLKLDTSRDKTPYYLIEYK